MQLVIDLDEEYNLELNRYYSEPNACLHAMYRFANIVHQSMSSSLYPLHLVLNQKTYECFKNMSKQYNISLIINDSLPDNVFLFMDEDHGHVFPGYKFESICPTPKIIKKIIKSKNSMYALFEDGTYKKIDIDGDVND